MFKFGPNNIFLIAQGVGHRSFFLSLKQCHSATAQPWAQIILILVCWEMAKNVLLTDLFQVLALHHPGEGQAHGRRPRSCHRRHRPLHPQNLPSPAPAQTRLRSSQWVRQQFLFIILGSGCSTAAEHTPSELNSWGRGLESCQVPGSFLLFSFLSVLRP